MLRSYPKIYALGHAAIKDLFVGPVSVTEKADGSQFSFGVVRGELECKSKGAQIDILNPNAMFAPAVATARRLYDAGLLAEGWIYRGEALAKPKHNTLCYNRAPRGGVILFDIDTGLESRLMYDQLVSVARERDLEVVPELFYGEVAAPEELFKLLDRESILGGQKIEGIVVKNYARWGADGMQLMGKYVSEQFKEIHRGDWKDRNPGRADIIDRLVNSYGTPARWQKAVIHLKEQGKLEGSPRDIGALIRLAGDDVAEECMQEIADTLYAHFWPDIRRGILKGLPEWYKKELALSQFGKGENDNPGTSSGA